MVLSSFYNFPYKLQWFFREKTFFFFFNRLFLTQNHSFLQFFIYNVIIFWLFCVFDVFAQGFPVNMQLFDQQIKTVALLARSCNNTFEQSICLLLMTMMILTTIRHGSLLAGWGSFEASIFFLFFFIFLFFFVFCVPRAGPGQNTCSWLWKCVYLVCFSEVSTRQNDIEFYVPCQVDAKESIQTLRRHL